MIKYIIKSNHHEDNVPSVFSINCKAPSCLATSLIDCSLLSSQTDTAVVFPHRANQSIDVGWM